MYQKASYKEQLRQFRNVLVDRSNTGGIDETAFRHPEKASPKKTSFLPPCPPADASFATWQEYRQALIEKKKIMEDGLTRIRNDIQIRAERAYHSRNGWDPTVAKLKEQQSELTSEFRDCELALCKAKQAMRGRAEKREHSLEGVFMATAKEMLAGPVYDRVLFAAVHRFKDGIEHDETP